MASNFGRHRAACAKVRYRDHKQAVKALHSTKRAATVALELTGATVRAECRTYECPRCMGWHLTSQMN